MANQTPNLKVRYEFDKSGRNPNNLVSNEQHTTTQRIRKIIVPHYGHFYNDSVILTDLTSGQEVPRTDYFFEDPSEVIALKTGLAASMIIVVTNSSLGNRFAVTYQAVGGEYTGANVNLLKQKLDNLSHDNRPVEWENIRNKPTTFNPADHRHPIYQTFGYESLIYIIERYIRAVLVGDEASHDVIWDELKKIRALINSSVTPVMNDFSNYKISQAELTNQLRQLINDLGTKIDGKAKEFNDKLAQHVAAQNPHRITPAIIGAPTTQELGTAINSLRTDLRALIDDRYTKAQTDLKINTVQTAVTNLQGSKLDKTARAADTTLFMGKPYQTVLNESSDKTIEDAKDDFVHMGTGTGQIRPAGAGRDMTNVVKIGKDRSNKLVKVSVDADDLGTMFNYRDGALADLNQMNTIDHIGTYKISYNGATRNMPINKSGTLIIVPATNGVTQIFYPEQAANARDTDSMYKRTSTSATAFTEWVKAPDYRDYISQEKTGNNANKLASEKALGDVNREITNVINNDIKTTLKDNLVKFTEGQSTIDRQAILKSLFGKAFNLGISNANVKDRTFADVNVDANKITARITELFGREQPKLIKDVIPISTVRENNIRWNKDGLYYGIIPDEMYANLYVDPDLGVDEPITLDNNRGTKDKPLATIGYALDQGTSGVRRTILLKEGKTHVIGKKMVSITGNNPVYEVNPNNHRSGTKVNFRGGTIIFRPYGPSTDALNEKIKAANSEFSSYGGSSEERHKEIIDLGCKIEFRGTYTGSNISRGGKSYSTFNKYCVDIENGTSLEFIGLTIKFGTDPVADAKVTADEFVYSSANIFNWWRTFTINFNVCSFDTGEPALYNSRGEKHHIALFSPSAAAQTFLFDNCIMSRNHYTGNNKVIEFRDATSTSIKFNRLDREIIGTPDFVPGKTYYSGLKIKAGMFYNVRTNIEPTQAEEFNVAKPGAPSGTKPAEIEVKDNKVYAVYHDGNNMVRVQIHPALWAG